jgi:hypothetical protein
MITTIQPSTKIETETCSRCGGSGNYSYCEMHGTTCFKCGGSGITYTKRGKIARDYLEALRSKKAEDVTVGESIRVDDPMSNKRYFIKITEVIIETPETAKTISNGKPVPYVYLNADKHSIGTFPGSMVRIAQTAEQKAATLKRALAFQDTLTKTGTPRKRNTTEVA